MYSDTSSASVADVMTCLMMWAMLRMAPLLGGDFCIVGHEEMPARVAFGLRFAEVAGVAVDRHDHLAAVVGEHHIFLCGEVVK